MSKDKSRNPKRSTATPKPAGSAPKRPATSKPAAKVKPSIAKKVAAPPKRAAATPLPGAAAKAKRPAPTSSRSSNEKLQDLFNSPDQYLPALVIFALTVVLIWSYWNSLTQVYYSWDNPLYSHGYLIPAFALVLMAMRYEPFTKVTAIARWSGLGLLLAGLGMRMFGTFYALPSVEMVSFVPSLMGVFLMVGGWSVLMWAGPAIAFLVFMFPQPDFFKRAVLENLLKVATVASTFVLQTLGIVTHREGNVIFVSDQSLNLVEACSGLRMLTIFIAMAVAIVLVVKRPWWDQLIILLSAIPIAVAANVIRITITGLLFLVAGDSPAVKDFFHDWAGLLVMMPVAMGLLYLELYILEKLVIDESTPELVRVGKTRGAGAMSPKPR